MTTPRTGSYQVTAVQFIRFCRKAGNPNTTLPV